MILSWFIIFCMIMYIIVYFCIFELEPPEDDIEGDDEDLMSYCPFCEGSSAWYDEDNKYWVCSDCGSQWRD